MQSDMMVKCSVYRTEESLQAVRDSILELRNRFQRVHVQDESPYFNTELVEALELGFMLDVAWTIAESALQRTESRGAHYREDYPERDDTNWLGFVNSIYDPVNDRVKIIKRALN